MDFISKLTDSLNFTWRNKRLWVSGFFLALAAGGGFSSQTNFDSNEFNDELSAIDSAEILIVAVIGGVIALAIALIVWYLSSNAKGAILTAIVEGKENPRIKESWNDGQKYVFKFIIMDLIWILVNLVIALPLIVTAIGGAIFPPLWIVFCCLMLVYFAYFAFAAMVYTGAQRLLVIENLSPNEALVRGFQVAKTKFSDYIIGFLVYLIPSCSWGIISCFILFIPGLLLTGVAIIAAATGEPFLILAIVGPAFLLFWLFQAAINSPFYLLGYTYWTKVVMEMTGHKEGTITAEVVE